MAPMIVVGIIVCAGFVLGEAAAKLRMPKVTGYIIAGVILNPEMLHLVPKHFLESTGIITDIALCFITFSVGGTLFYPKVKALGKSIVIITLFEAECAFLVVAVGFLLVAPHFANIPGATFVAVILPMSLLLGSLGSPTDPSATLAVAHQYKAKGDVSSTIMGVAAMDDATGIMNYSLAVSVASVLGLHESFSVVASVVRPLLTIAGSIGIGIGFGLIFNLACRILRRETDGAFIVIILGLLTLCFGAARVAGLDELLSTMTMGVTVVNFCIFKERVFKVLERYTEELVFVLFFTISGMHLDFAVLASSAGLVVAFVVLRAIGKLVGTVAGAKVGGASKAVRKYAVGGLIPQGGIVIGLALIIRQNPVFAAFSDIVINVVLGATVIHEIIGPILAELSLKKAGEIPSD